VGGVRCVSSALVLFGLAACGGRSASHASAGPAAGAAGSAGDASMGGATGGIGATSGSSAAGGAGAMSGLGGQAGEAEPEYGGVVLAYSVSDGTDETHHTFAGFQAAGPFDPRACGDCCCYHGIGLPLPTKPPDAGTITLTSGEVAAPLALLAPDVPADGSLHLYGSWELSAWGLGGISDYAPADSLPWAPGDVLEVSAAGNEVAPFSGQLRTGLPISDLTPALGTDPVVVDLTQGLEVSWAPEGGEDRRVEFAFQQFDTGVSYCFCSAPDEAGLLSVSSEALVGFTPGSATALLARFTETNTTSDNATITLLGGVEVAGTLELR